MRFGRNGVFTRISHRLTGKARDRPGITSLRLLAVLNALCRGDVGPEADAARQEARATSAALFGCSSSALRICDARGPSQSSRGDSQRENLRREPPADLAAALVTRVVALGQVTARFGWEAVGGRTDCRRPRSRGISAPCWRVAGQHLADRFELSSVFREGDCRR